jgi:hypothetical protein
MPPPFQALSQSAPQTTPNSPAQETPDDTQTQQGDPQSPPVEFDVHIKAAPEELQQAIDVLKEAGLEDIATVLEKALQPALQSNSNDASTQSLTDEISAMGNNPHSGM